MLKTNFAYWRLKGVVKSGNIFITRFVVVAVLFLVFSQNSFCQQKDSAFEFKTADSTVEVMDTIVVNKRTNGDTEDDTTGKAKYNYYINTELWPADSFEFRRVPDTVISSLKSKDDFWYADYNFHKQDPESSPSSGNFFNWLSLQKWFKVLIWMIIIGGFVAVLIWYLAESNATLFRRKPKTIAGEEQSAMSENIFEINYQKEIAVAVQNRDYRLATRLMFLQLLKRLSEKNIIQYKQDRTNFDYLLQLSSTSYYKDFFRLARNYEYAWYGEFDVNDESFSIIKNDFEKFDNKLS